MNHQIIQLFRRSALLLMACGGFRYAQSQCVYSQIMHTTGTQQVGCSEVTVSSAGSVGPYPSPFPDHCGYVPFVIGNTGDGSHTFSFSPAITGVKFSFSDMNANYGGMEELVVYINGGFYPITIPGTDDGCQYAAMISPTGTISLNWPGYISSWKDVTINTNISTLTIEDHWLSSSPALGVLLSLYVCCENCGTEAGQIPSGNYTQCVTQPTVVLPQAGQTVLYPGDVLQYVLFTNPSDIFGSILATNNVPEFSFNSATMSTGVAYYVAAIAGNNGVGGNVDLNDPCLSISNQVPVTWQPMPSVAFTSYTDCLQPGGCYDIDLSFNGTPPFQLNARVLQGGNVIANFLDIYTSTSDIMVLCLPSAIPDGPITIEALSLTDAYCTCN